MIRRILALCLLISLLCLQVVSETIPFEKPVGLQIGKRFISGPLIIQGGNENITIDEYTLVKSVTINDTGVTLEPYPDITEVGIIPTYTQLNEIGSFIVQINVVPSQPIKGVEINMSFNPSQLQITDVLEGDLFDGYPTFFVVHEINNNMGFLVAYGLIVGQGNTSDDGDFVSITFNAMVQGASSLILNDVGVTNETQYLDLLVGDATIYIAYSWDVVPDRSINYLDISSTVSHYWQSGGNGWIRADINDDGIVNYIDISAVISKYGKNY